MSLAAWVLAEVSVPTWVGIPTGIAGLGIPLALWLRGTTTLTSDCNQRIAALTSAHSERTTAMDSRLTALIADRDAWRSAHSAEVEARIVSEKAAAAMLEQVRSTSTQALLVEKMIDVVVASVKGAVPSA